MRLRVVPCNLDEANAFVCQHHRHHGPVSGHKFSIAVVDEADAPADAAACPFVVFGVFR